MEDQRLTASRTKPPTAAAAPRMKYQVVESVKRPVKDSITCSLMLCEA